MLECVIDLMAADILSSVLQYFNGSDCALNPNTTAKLVSLAFSYMKTRESRKLKTSAWKLVRTKISEQWTIILGQLCPMTFSNVVRYFSLFWPTNTAPKTSMFTKTFSLLDGVEYMRGIRYVRLEPIDANSIRDLGDYLSLHVRIHDAHRKDDSNGSNYIALENAQFMAIQHVIQMCDFAQCDAHAYSTEQTAGGAAATAGSGASLPPNSPTAKDQKTVSFPTGSSGAAGGGAGGAVVPAVNSTSAEYAPPPLDAECKRLLLTIFNQSVVRIYEICMARAAKSEDVRIAARKLMATIIMHGTHAFFGLKTDDFIKDVLCKGIRSDAAKRAIDLGVLLHLLRGGGGTELQMSSRIRYRNGVVIDKIGQVYGFMAHQRRISDSSIDHIYKKLFVKKMIAKTSDCRQLCERLLLHMCLHQFKLTAGFLLEMNEQHKGNLEQLMVLRVLEVMVDDKSGFNAFGLRHNGGGLGAMSDAAAAAAAVSTAAPPNAAAQKWALQLKTFQTDFVPLLLNVIKQCDSTVGLRQLGLTQSVFSPTEFDDRDREGAEDGDFTKFVHVDEYDLRTERALQPMETDAVWAHLK